MKLTFSYDAQKDEENFLKSAHAKNNKKPTKLQRLYFEKFGTDPEPEKATGFIVEYLQTNGIDAEEKVREVEAQWRLVEGEVLQRMQALFGTDYPTDIIVYLSTNSRCTYRIAEGYFFVHMESPHPVGIIVHELLHFYTWHVFYGGLEEKGMSPEEYNDIKEALTELLNLRFSDLLAGYIDTGYPQHEELRATVRMLWREGKSLPEIIDALAG